MTTKSKPWGPWPLPVYMGDGHVGSLAYEISTLLLKNKKKKLQERVNYALPFELLWMWKHSTKVPSKHSVRVRSACGPACQVCVRPHKQSTLCSPGALSESVMVLVQQACRVVKHNTRSGKGRELAHGFSGLGMLSDTQINEL